MKRIKFKGGAPPFKEVYRSGSVTLLKGETIELPDEEADRLLNDFPHLFEMIDKRAHEAPPQDRMVRKPGRKRGRSK